MLKQILSKAFRGYRIVFFLVLYFIPTNTNASILDAEPLSDEEEYWFDVTSELVNVSVGVSKEREIALDFQLIQPLPFGYPISLFIEPNLKGSNPIVFKNRKLRDYL